MQRTILLGFFLLMLLYSLLCPYMLSITILHSNVSTPTFHPSIYSKKNLFIKEEHLEGDTLEQAMPIITPSTFSFQPLQGLPPRYIEEKIDSPAHSMEVKESPSKTESKNPLQQTNTTARAQPIVDTKHQIYSYNEMQSDIQSLRDKYPDKVTVISIGESVMGQDITCLILGNIYADKKILIHGSIHGREYMTSQLLMCQVEYYVERNPTESYENRRFIDLFNKVAFYYVPMVNPDGVTLSQQGLSWIDDPEIKNELLSMNEGSENFEKWKANIRGVDLNRNFNAHWDAVEGPLSPSNSFYKGASPESEPESKALGHFTRQYDFDATISYHSKGSIIYWYYFQEDRDYERDYRIAKELSYLTNYTLVDPESSIAPIGGYKDWYVLEFSKPGFTIEIGQSSSSSPLSISEFKDIWKKNKYTSLHLAYLLMEE